MFYEIFAFVHTHTNNVFISHWTTLLVTGRNCY